ncbi:IclR family transcriptional regulator [Nocardioides sp. NPDC059952]|uniref:IclR family transcriptional regulator n=1 Tax=Nocardioides sp. NPDC059952 TaxID=3347014 RepID=UPI0036604908
MEPGPSVIRRSATLLRLLAAREPEGATTTQLATTAAIPRPTAHRLLSALQDEGLVERDNDTAAWHLGPECFLLGAAATTRHDITPAARAAVLHIARETGESAFFSIRRGEETVCVLREDGSFPIRSHVLYEGIRFPLGVASAGLAILAFMPESRREAYLARTDLVAAYGEQHSAAALRERVAATRELGFAVNPGLIVVGSWGLGAAVFDAHGQPYGALTITGIEARLAPPRQAELGRLLLEAAHSLTTKARSGPESGLPA